MNRFPGYHDHFPPAPAPKPRRDGWKAAQKAYLFAPRGKKVEREQALKRLTTERLRVEIAGRVV